MNQLQVFNFESHSVRVVELNGEPHFIAKDVCDVLLIANSRDALSRLDADEKGVASTDTPGGNQQMQVVNEMGLYSLVLSSRKPEAKAFKRWITHEVIPAIRKTGRYEMPSSLEDQALVLAGHVQRLISEKRQLQASLAEAQPKVEFYDQVADSRDALAMHVVAKMLGIEGLGRNKLFEFLREQKVLDENNTPYQTYMNQGWFRVRVAIWHDSSGNAHPEKQTLVFQKGIDGIRKLWVRANPPNQQMFVVHAEPLLSQ